MQTARATLLGLCLAVSIALGSRLDGLGVGELDWDVQPQIFRRALSPLDHLYQDEEANEYSELEDLLAGYMEEEPEQTYGEEQESLYDVSDNDLQYEPRREEPNDKGYSFGGAREETGRAPIVDYDEAAGRPIPRDAESLQHSASLWGTKFVQTNGLGGHGSDDIKSDSVLPAYCEPPNPCPVGYSEEDGCIETFENTASFSREYQAAQECMCDTEHMFGCPAADENDKISTLARTMTQHGISHQELNGFLKSVNPSFNTPRIVSKKFFRPARRAGREGEGLEAPGLEQEGQDVKEKATQQASRHVFRRPNPFAQGERLPVAAKKG